MMPPASESKKRPNEGEVPGGSVATRMPEIAAWEANSWPEPSSTAMLVDSSTISAICHAPTPVTPDDEVCDPEPHGDAEGQLDGALEPPADAQAEHDDGRDRREDRPRVAEDLDGEEPGGGGRDRDLHDRAGGELQALGALAHREAPALGRVLEQLARRARSRSSARADPVPNATPTRR